jgi:hypothetical protein
MRKEYPAISAEAVNSLLQVPASYLCEQGFSCLTNIKSKRLESSADCRGKSVSVFVKNVAKNSKFLQKQTSPGVTFKVNFILTLGVNFILMLSKLCFYLIF